MSSSLTPTGVTVDVEAQQLSVSWSDGHTSTYPLDGLRRACPCVGCRGGHEQMGGPPDPSVMNEPAVTEWHDVKVEVVGGYGLRIRWDDGHDDGIYTWQRLRGLDPAPPA